MAATLVHTRGHGNSPGSKIEYTIIGDTEEEVSAMCASFKKSWGWGYGPNTTEPRYAAGCWTAEAYRWGSCD